MYNFSFIIPHKNSPDLLQRCLDSIPSDDDIQIIIVDDNSDGRIVDFSNFPGAERKNTLCIFNKDGKGAGRARNIALSHASGTWLIFADADDLFAPSISEILNKYRYDEKTEMVFFNYSKMKANGDIIPMPITRYIANYLNGRMFSEQVLRYSAWSPWSRMVKREIPLRNNILFEELPFSNDMMFVLRTTAVASIIKAESSIAYYYYSPSSGTQTSVQYHDPKLRCLRLEGRLKLWRFYREIGYLFIRPLWMAEKDLRIKADTEIKTKYGFKAIDNVRDTICYLFAKLFRIL